jgi:hypothetical protein
LQQAGTIGHHAFTQLAYDVDEAFDGIRIVSVRCTGDRRLLEQVGEKREFECLLSAWGLPHENFELRVRRVRHRQLGDAWSCDYAVSVTRTDADLRHVYLGGPSYRWLSRFAADLANGKYRAQASASSFFSTQGRVGASASLARAE